MHRSHHRWYSPSLNRDMELLVFGHAGPPMLVFPSSMGAFFEYEDRHMIDAVEGKLERGGLQLCCVSSVDGESWYNRRAHPRDRVRRHLQYEDYILTEVVPLMHQLNPHHAIGVTGCSFGAYHAMTVALRRPHIFTWCVAMSGAFDITQFLDGYFDEDCYFLNPPSFLPNLSDANYLDHYRRNKFVLTTGEWDICRAATESFSRLLHHKGIPHSLHIWGDGSKHDWPDWRPMAQAYLP